jgi:hypothetical protein
MTVLNIPLRSSLPQQRWREEADAQERKRAAAEAAARQRSQVSQQQNAQSAAAAAEQSLQAQFTALRNELEQLREAKSDALIEYVVHECEKMRADVRLMLKRARAEIEDGLERKTANFRPPAIRGTYDPNKIFLQHDLVIKNGGSFIARRDGAGVCPGPDWQQLTQPGKTGAKGERGFAGARGPQGESGANFLT